MGAPKPPIITTMQITLKEIGYGIVFLLVTGIAIQSYRLSIAKSKLKDSGIALALIKESLKHKQDSIDLLAIDAITLRDKNDSLTVIVNKLSQKNKNLDKKLKDALSNIDSIPPDVNYAYLQDSAYVYPGDKVYPFNGTQVTEIRKDYVENDILKKINLDYVTFTDVLRIQIGVQDSMIGNQYEQLGIYEGMVTSLTDVLSAAELDKSNLNKEMIRQKRGKFIFLGSTVAEALTILTLILL